MAKFFSSLKEYDDILPFKNECCNGAELEVWIEEIRVCIRCTECNAHLNFQSRMILDGLYGQDTDNREQRPRKSPLHIIVYKLYRR